MPTLGDVCANCLSQAEVLAGHAGLVAALVKAPVHRALADLGLVDAPDPVARDARTVTFLRRLELDPIDVLGAAVVARADAWMAPTQSERALARASAWPIGSHSLLHTQ